MMPKKAIEVPDGHVAVAGSAVYQGGQMNRPHLLAYHIRKASTVYPRRTTSSPPWVALGWLALAAWAYLGVSW